MTQEAYPMVIVKLEVRIDTWLLLIALLLV